MTDQYRNDLARELEIAIEDGTSLDNLCVIVEKAAAVGAARVLEDLGLQDTTSASIDISELRALLDAWRDVKRTARQTAIKWIVRFLITVIALGLAVKFKFLQLG